MCFFPRGGRRGVRGAERGPCRRPPQPGYGAAPPAGSGRVGPRPAPPASSSRLRTQGGGLRARAAWSRVPGRRRGSAALSARSTPAAPGRARRASPARGSRSPHPPPTHTHTNPAAALHGPVGAAGCFPSDRAAIAGPALRLNPWRGDWAGRGTGGGGSAGPRRLRRARGSPSVPGAAGAGGAGERRP